MKRLENAKKSLFLGILLVFLAVPAAVSAQSSSVTLGWTLSTATGITNQTLYWGPSPGNYTNAMNLSPTATTAQLTGLVQDAPYFFSLTCTDNKGLTSFKAVELQWTALPVPPTGMKIIGP